VIDSHECPRCRKEMDPGYRPDYGYGQVRREEWASGKPQRSFWFGVKTRDLERLPVVTFRCPGCGYLESYARPE